MIAVADLTANNIIADSVTADEANLGSVVVRGAARFVQPIYTTGIHGSQDVNQVATGSTINNSDYVFISSNGSMKRILYSDFIDDVASKTADYIADGDGVSY